MIIRCVTPMKTSQTEVLLNIKIYFYVTLPVERIACLLNNVDSNKKKILFHSSLRLKNISKNTTFPLKCKKKKIGLLEPFLTDFVRCWYFSTSSSFSIIFSWLEKKCAVFFSSSGFGGKTQRRCQECGESQSDVMAAPVSCFLGRLSSEPWQLPATSP